VGCMIGGLRWSAGKGTYFKDGGEGKEGIGGEDEELGASVDFWISRQREMSVYMCVLVCYPTRSRV